MMKKLTALLLSLTLAALLAAAEYAPAPPVPDSYVNDYAAVVVANQRETMQLHAEEFYRLTGIRLVLLTLQSLDGQSAQKAAQSSAQDWALTDQSVLILLSVEGPSCYLLVGDGVKEYLNEYQVSAILDEITEPLLAEGKYSRAAYETFMATGRELAERLGVDTATKKQSAGESGSIVSNIGFIVLTVVLLLFTMLRLRGNKARFGVSSYTPRRRSFTRTHGERKYDDAKLDDKYIDD